MKWNKAEPKLTILTVAKCKCKEGWTGESCSCTTDTTDCINPADRGKPGAKPCSGKGDCNCGSCSCWDFGEKLGSYYGTYCDRFASQCDIYEDCVLCVANAANSNLTLGMEKKLGIKKFSSDKFQILLVLKNVFWQILTILSTFTSTALFLMTSRKSGKSTQLKKIPS